MTGAADLLDFLVERLADVETAWSIGTFGAVCIRQWSDGALRHVWRQTSTIRFATVMAPSVM